MNENEQDQMLIERIQSGDKAAFDILVRKYQNKVANLISRYVRNPSDIADVAQETFIKAYRAIPGFRGDSAFYTWLYRIAVNSAKNYLVAQGRKPPGTDVDVDDAEFYDGGDVLQENSSPEKLALSEEVQNVIFETIESLPDDLRISITLREIEGLSYEDIAKVMDCPVGTVRSRIFRAREKIDEKIAPLLQQ